MDAETLALIQKTASDAAEKAVRNTLMLLGVDTANPIEAQKNMATLREVRDLVEDPEFQADMMHLRKWRKAMDQIRTKGLLTIMGIVAAGVVGLLWLGLKTKFFGG